MSGIKNMLNFCTLVLLLEMPVWLHFVEYLGREKLLSCYMLCSILVTIR